jgi:hypothetical protein
MKPMIIIAAFSFWSALFGYEAKMRVVDDTGAPVQGADVAIEFVAPRQEQSVTYRGTTGKEGTFSAQGQSLLEVYMEAKKSGHYDARVYGLSPKKDHDLVVVIPRVLNPISLCASRVNPRIPAQNEWLGYDFEVADWVAPHGKGKIADIRLRFRNEFMGWKHSEKQLEHSRKVNSQLTEKEFKDNYGKWDAELDISFPGEKEGLFEETHFLAYSQLKLPHKAPVEGYVPTWRYTSKTYSPPTTRDNVGFFLRTRVKLDEKGTILSANYAKIMGDIHCAATGVLRFVYYFNPVANDRNLEFDPKKNLFPASLPGANVNDP